MSALDQSFKDLAERHNLLSASVDYLRAGHGDWFHGSVQWGDASKEHGRAIATYSADTFAEALNGAVAKMHTMRGVAEFPADGLELAA